MTACAPVPPPPPLPPVFAGSVDGFERLPDDETDLVEADEAPSAENIAQSEHSIRELFPAAEPQYDERTATDVLRAYAHLDPGGVVPAGLLRKAILYFNTHKAKFPNQRYISVIDYAKHSSNARFFVINMKDGSVWALRVVHGKGSDPDHNGYADVFGNDYESHMSSLGYIRTAETYNGKHGRSLRLDGLSATNSNMRGRAVVVHGSHLVWDQRKIQGRSKGCPAVPMAQKDRLIDMIRGGSLVYAGRTE
jgi:hypothetical protein